MKSGSEISSSQSLKNSGSDGFFNTSLMYVLAACLASFLFGYQVSVLNTIKDFIVIEFGWCPENAVSCDGSTLKSSFLLASVFIGAVVGSGFSGYLVQYGRRFSLLVIYNFFILVSILTSITHHFHTILFSRLLSGFGIGLITVSVPMYISEMTHKDKKGAYGVLHQLFITFGIFIAVLLGMAMGDVPEKKVEPLSLGNFQQIWWRLMFFFPCIISILGIVLLTFFFKEETPYYLFENGKVEESKKILKKIYGSDNVDEPLKAIKDAVEQNEAAKKNSISLMTAMKIPSYRYVILLGCILSGLQQFTGINVLVSNSNELYKGFLDKGMITTLSVIMTVVNFLMTFPAIYIVEKLGRKTLLLCGCAGIVCAFLPTAIANQIDSTSEIVKNLSIAATFVMIVSFAVSYGPVLWIYLHEMFPSEIKDSAASLASLVNWMCAIIVVFPSDIIIKKSPNILFFIFSGMSILAFFFIFFFIKETKGGEIGTSPYITLEERQKHMGKSVV
ncbi:Hexose transporter [Plasmodium coatneyi]|uniref:Hexose transporter 1 n=1 Tax=Plasmodium coatneyi TaxID=208452 RepID=A0A1B1DU80_9APIC|nr:Hexose transporter [Plasmodium coatneyi]ANQ06312.1 Hexose transporter [Plasmodium coatneyi]